MKENIHPDYMATKIVCLSCATEVETRATVPLIRVDLCSNCHPFYTGKQRIVDTAGRVDRFNQRRATAEKTKKAIKTREEAKSTPSAS
jgi:large subunit ribosomal protein L31